MPWRTQRQKRPTGTQAAGGNTGSHSSMLASAIGNEVGGIKGDSGAGAGIGTGDDSGGAGNDPSNAMTPSTINASGAPTYAVKHPILDFILNQGRGAAAANQANIGTQQFGYQSSVQQANALQLQHDMQNFDAQKQQISYDNSLSLAQKESLIKQNEAQQAQHLAVMQAKGVVWTPAADQAMQDTVNPVAINAAESGAAATDATNKGIALAQSAKNDSMSSHYPTIVNTENNGLFASNLASQGAVQNQTLKNIADRFEQLMRPTDLRNRINKEPIIPTGPGTTLYNANTGGINYRAPIPDIMTGVMSGMNFGGNTGRTSTLPSGLGTAPQQAASGTLTPAAYPKILGDGRILNPDGSIINLDGTTTPAGQ